MNPGHGSFGKRSEKITACYYFSIRDDRSVGEKEGLITFNQSFECNGVPWINQNPPLGCSLKQVIERTETHILQV
jgi:hypothetical protein